MAVGANISIKVLNLLIGIPVGLAMKKLVERTWEVARPDDPERHATDPDVNWGDAVAWAALSAVGIVIADLLTRRGSEAAFSALTGSTPPAAKPSRAAKKLQQAAEKSPATKE